MFVHSPWFISWTMETGDQTGGRVWTMGTGPGNKEEVLVVFTSREKGQNYARTLNLDPGWQVCRLGLKDFILMLHNLVKRGVNHVVLNPDSAGGMGATIPEFLNEIQASGLIGSETTGDAP